MKTPEEKLLTGLWVDGCRKDNWLANVQHQFEVGFENVVFYDLFEQCSDLLKNGLVPLPFRLSRAVPIADEMVVGVMQLMWVGEEVVLLALSS